MADSPLITRLRAGGIVAPSTTIAEAARARLPLALACALLEKESSGGHNVFGHDAGTIFAGAGEVTRAKYRDYKRQRDAGGKHRMQGVGPCQLTWWELQDTADREGGCWRPEINMRIGFRHLQALIEAHGEADGARRYNGTGDAAVAYSKDLLAKREAWERRLAGLPVHTTPPTGPHLLRRGDEGERVQRLTRRLSYVRSRATGEPYLDGVRARFDAETEAALEAFQDEHGLEDDGVFGPETLTKLKRAVEREKERRAGAGAPPAVKPPAAKPPAKEPPAARPPAKERPAAREDDLQALVAAARRADRRNDEALDELLAHGRRLRRRFERERFKPDPGGGAGADDVAAILLRIEAKLETLVRASEREPVAALPAPAETVALPPSPVGAGASLGATAPVGATASPGATAALGATAPSAASAGTDVLVATATVAPAVAPPAPLPEGPLAPGPPANGSGGVGDDRAPGLLPGPPLEDLPDREIARRIRALDAAIDEARGVLVERFARYERALGPPAPRPKPKAPPQAKRPARPPAKPAVPKRRPPAQPGRGSVVDVHPGARGHLVRSSKLALSRFLAARGNQEHVGLRRALRREARSRRNGKLASAHWEQAVRAAQHIAGQPVTGIMDGELERILHPFWPPDSLMRRIVRSTPAWRAIPGQVSPNFNLRELACKDGTPYVAGLVREQGLSEQQAKRRAKELATRLERVRKADGDRRLHPTSAFRTRSHNAKQPGAVPNSSHLRGFAVDVPPPPGVTIERHHAHMRAAFERGVGFYPMGRGYFVHGDFDPDFPRRDW